MYDSFLHGCQHHCPWFMSWACRWCMAMASHYRTSLKLHPGLKTQRVMGGRVTRKPPFRSPLCHSAAGWLWERLSGSQNPYLQNLYHNPTLHLTWLIRASSVADPLFSSLRSPTQAECGDSRLRLSGSSALPVGHTRVQIQSFAPKAYWYLDGPYAHRLCISGLLQGRKQGTEDAAHEDGGSLKLTLHFSFAGASSPFLDVCLLPSIFVYLTCLSQLLFFLPSSRWPNCRINIYFSQIKWLIGLLAASKLCPRCQRSCPKLDPLRGHSPWREKGWPGAQNGQSRALSSQELGHNFHEAFKDSSNDTRH